MSFRSVPTSRARSERRVRRRHRDPDADSIRQTGSSLISVDPESGVARVIYRQKPRWRLDVSKEVMFAIGVITTALQGGGLIFGWTAFAGQLVNLKDSPYDNENVGSIFAIGHNITAFACILSGILFDAWGPRACAVSGFLIEAVGHFIMTQILIVPEFVAYIGYGLLGLGGCQVMLAALSFTEAFANSGLTSSILTTAFQAGGFVFMALHLQFVEWKTFFFVYMMSCICSAALTALVYPDFPPTSEAQAEPSEMAGLAAAVASQKTLKQVLRQRGTIGFLTAFCITGSALTYGQAEFTAVLSLKADDSCSWSPEKCTQVEHLMNNVLMPLVGNFTLPCSLALGWLIDKKGFGLAGFINILSVQLFVAALLFFPLEGQFATMFIYNVANSAVFTVQSAYICDVGSKHIGSLFAISNGVLGTGNLLADAFANKNFTNWLGLGDSVKESLPFSVWVWIILCTPVYFWVVIEIRRRRQRIEGEETLASTFASSYTRGTSYSRGTSRATSMRSNRAGEKARPLIPQTLEVGNEAPAEARSATGSFRRPRILRQDQTPAFSPVLTVNPQAWETKISNVVQAGANRCFCVFDFDRTVTKCFLEDGGRSLDCHDILASIPKITPECKQTMEEMMDHYYPIEIHPTMTREEKIPHMVEWYAKVNFLLASQDLNRDDVVEAVARCVDFRIRAGVEEAFGILHEKGIPIIICSAGLGNVIEEVVRQRIRKPNGVLGETWDNVRVLSNTMIWDEKGEFCEFSEPLIHMYNKSLQDAPADLKKMIEGRSVGILCGDGLGDLTMAHGHETTDVLKFGFLNEKIQERMPKYIAPDGFDRIILNDGDWGTVLADIFRKI